MFLCRQQERGFTFENRYASLTYHKVDGGTDYLSEAKSITDENIEKVLRVDVLLVIQQNQFLSYYDSYPILHIRYLH